MAGDDVTPQDRVPRAGHDKASPAAIGWPSKIKTQKPRKRLRITVRNFHLQFPRLSNPGLAFHTMWTSKVQSFRRTTVVRIRSLGSS